MRFLEQFKRLITLDLANQFAIPVQSLPGWFLSKSSAKHNLPLYKACIDFLPLLPDDYFLEIGYGRGEMLKLCHDLIRKENGKGVVYGVERSQYMEDVARKRFALEIVEDGSIQLNRVLDLRHLPYPNDIFHGIAHIDVFYFWKEERIAEICREFFRVLKPGHKVVCAMEFERLKKLEKWGLLSTNQWNPVRYLSHLEPAGFVNVKIDYTESGKRKIQLVTAMKPDVDEDYFNPEERMRKLERDVKRQMVLNDMMNKGYKPTADDLELLQDKELFK
ncbi:unnamed protein product, partial [Mesorhabditis belari]|uniref:Methyltransferase type 11 domain-containing protein n=1 Tax=Mesorhabditis belari TaxID=2138241 RepID=A0AAF3EJ70_9BILA